MALKSDEPVAIHEGRKPEAHVPGAKSDEQRVAVVKLHRTRQVAAVSVVTKRENERIADDNTVAQVPPDELLQVRPLFFIYIRSQLQVWVHPTTMKFSDLPVPSSLWSMEKPVVRRVWTCGSVE